MSRDAMAHREYMRRYRQTAAYEAYLERQKTKRQAIRRQIVAARERYWQTVPGFKGGAGHRDPVLDTEGLAEWLAVIR